jgi:hypothetical protein
MKTDNQPATLRRNSVDKRGSDVNIKTGILVDPVGHGFGEVTPEQEIEGHIHDYSELLRPHTLKPYRLDSAHKIKPGTRLVLFDYGGMISSYGAADLISSEARALLRWTADNPSALVIVVSSFTYRNVIQYELEDMGLALHNVVCRESVFEDPIPLWFRTQGEPDKTPIPIEALAHPIAGLTPVGGTLGDSQFFKPKKAFINWFTKTFKDEFKVYEVGSGMGHTAKALAGAGVKIVAIDANRRPGSVFAAEIQDATEYSFRMDPVVLICRPCHGPFCEAVIQRAVFCRANCIVYAGLPKNVADDLGRFRKFFKCTLTNAGEDKESVYVWRPEWNKPEAPKAAKPSL